MLVTAGVAAVALGAPSGVAKSTGDSQQTIGEEFSSGTGPGGKNISGPGGHGNGGAGGEDDSGGAGGTNSPENADSPGGSEVKGGSAASSTRRSTDSSSLPFTGASILVLALLGTGLLAAGLLLRRRQTLT